MNDWYWVIVYIIGIVVGVWLGWSWWGEKASNFDKMKESRNYYLNKYNDLVCEIYKKTIRKEL